MRRTQILNAAAVKRTTFQEAKSAFMRHCKLRNLRPQTLRYYDEDLTYFHSRVPVRYVDAITQEVCENFLVEELENGKRVSSLNSRIRGLRVFFKFCAEREYMKPLTLKLMKEDEAIKEPYTEAELLKLLKKPESNSWVEWRNWTAVNYLISTGNRASTVLDLRVKDIDFEEMTIHLRTMKNRRQQVVPLSPALKSVLKVYLMTWKWTADDYLFPSYEGGALSLRSFQGAIARYNVSRDVSKTSIHLFRHTFAKNFIMAGGGMVQLQTLLGHSTLDMTRHYIDVYGLDLKRDYERLNPLDNIQKRQASR